MGEAGHVIEDIDEARMSLSELLRSSDAAVLSQRPPSGEWSPIENVRHLLFAEQLHLGRFLPDGFTWSSLGLRPHFLANEEAFSQVGSEPPASIEALLAAWDTVHAPMREAVSGGTEEMQKALEGNLGHTVFHVRIIETLLGESRRLTGRS